MPCLSPHLGLRIRTWLRDYDRIQSLAVLLIYIQIGCALLGSLGALFNGVLLVNLVIALFALVAIESSSQRLGRTYAVLLLCAIVLDVAWFILFSHSIWNFGLEKYGSPLVFSVRLAFSMQIAGFSMRFLSSFLWIQMYTLGASAVDNLAYQDADFDVGPFMIQFIILLFLKRPQRGLSKRVTNKSLVMNGALHQLLGHPNSKHALVDHSRLLMEVDYLLQSMDFILIKILRVLLSNCTVAVHSFPNK